MHYYFGELGKRMVACGARDMDEFVLRGEGLTGLTSLSQARVANRGPADAPLHIRVIAFQAAVCGASHASIRWLQTDPHATPLLRMHTRNRRERLIRFVIPAIADLQVIEFAERHKPVML